MDFAQSMLDLDTSVFSSNDNWFQQFPESWFRLLSGYGACGIESHSGSSIMRLYYHNDVDTTFLTTESARLRVNMFHQEFVS